MTRRVLITGVSSGIGLAQASLFLANGWAVYGVDVSDKPDLAGDFYFLQWDVTGDISSLADFCQQPDVLCLTAGVLDDFRPHLDTSEVDFARIFDINFFSVTRIVNYYLPAMVERRDGIVITMCSIASFLAAGGGSAYTSSKHALAGFTRQLAFDYAKAGIQVFGIAPGAVRTEMTEADFAPDGLADWVIDQTPIGRYSQPKEIADLTYFLASGKAQSMQGQIIKIDGGWSLK